MLDRYPAITTSQFTQACQEFVRRSKNLDQSRGWTKVSFGDHELCIDTVKSLGMNSSRGPSDGTDDDSPSDDDVLEDYDQVFSAILSLARSLITS